MKIIATTEKNAMTKKNDHRTDRSASLARDTRDTPRSHDPYAEILDDFSTLQKGLLTV